MKASSVLLFASLARSTLGFHSPHRIAIVGGGLAGLSVAFHLLKNTIERSRPCQITILDKAPPGLGGASAVAGGLLHPFSPSGKLLYKGDLGLQVTNEMIDCAQTNCVTSDYFYRVALSSSHVTQLKDTARLYPQWATWIDVQDLIAQGLVDTNISSEDKPMGALRLSNGCKVLHVPTYLQGLWTQCQDIAPNQGDSVTWSIIREQEAPFDGEYLKNFETVIFCAGSGLFMDGGLLQDSSRHFPVQLVRGQSVEFSFPIDSIATLQKSFQPVLCGKYVAPSSTFPLKVVVGATHEYQTSPLDSANVLRELRDATWSMCPQIWKHGIVEKITQGYRVQSKRHQHGRLPIVGQIKLSSVGGDCWVFTGLSSRGLIYHGLFGSLLSSAIMKGTDQNLPKWWI